MFEQYNDVVTVKELCQMLHIGRNTAYDLIHSGAVTTVMIGRQIRISKRAVEKFIFESGGQLILCCKSEK